MPEPSVILPEQPVDINSQAPIQSSQIQSDAASPVSDPSLTQYEIPLPQEPVLTAVQAPQNTPAMEAALQTADFNNGNVQTILDTLLANNSITQQQYDEVKVKSANGGKSVESVLIGLNIVDDTQLAQARAKMLGVPFISLTDIAFSPEALSFIPQPVVERFHLVPFNYDDKTKTLCIAMSNPVDLEAIQFVRQKTGLTIKAFASSDSDVERAINTQYRQELVGEVGKAIKETQELRNEVKTINSAQIGEIIKEAPIAKIVSTILEYAVTSRASDVHIEPMDDRVRVRYRIDGILYDRLTLPKTVQEAVISRIKFCLR